jgi:hypothetical protein
MMGRMRGRILWRCLDIGRVGLDGLDLAFCYYSIRTTIITTFARQSPL